MENGDPMQVLVVEDDPGVQRLMVAFLRMAGHEVITAGAAAEALALAHSAMILIIVDVNLGGDCGLDLACDLRAALPDVRILLTSGEPEAMESAVASLQPGAATLRKPFSMDAFRTTVAELIRQQV